MRIAAHISEQQRRTAGRAAWVAAFVGTLVAPLHALGRYRTADGKSDLDSDLVRAWAEPAARHLKPILDFGGTDGAYLTYGKVWFPVFLAATVCAFLVRSDRRASVWELRGAEKWGWRIALTGYVLATAGVFTSYWLQLVDEGFVVFDLPGMLASLVGSTMLGIALLRRRFHPATTAWLLALWIPLFLVIGSFISLGACALPMIWAWAVAGRRMAVETPHPARQAQGTTVIGDLGRASVDG
jgi:hypothetical protein